MKSLIAILLVFVVSTVQGAFLELQTDKELYTVGERAVLIAHSPTGPINSNFEMFLVATFNNERAEIIKITDKEAVTLPAQFLASGNFEWRVSIYQQNIQKAKKYSATILFYTNQIIKNRILLETETDPVKIDLLNASIVRAELFIVVAREKLEKNRVLLEEKSLFVTVQDSKRLEQESPAILIESNHATHTFVVGEKAIFTTTILTTLEGQELVVRAKIDEIPVGVVKLSESEYKSESNDFVAGDIGEHNYAVEVYLRPKFRSDSLREAIGKAQIMRNSYDSLFHSTLDPNLKAYYLKKREDMDRVVQAFYSILEEMLTLFGTKDYQFTVV